MPAWLVKLLPLIMNKVLALGQDYILDYINKLIAAVKKSKRAKVQEEAKKEFEQVINKPESTVEERGKAYEDYLNSGR
jgi:hypothetical protein